ncbi:hypothetical protein NMY22_g1857 [Coprinellus aureogranulatus]|nr:hypothetical protein NMY22_g1857 [Coprinellus aureogranulatus]
MPFTHLISPVTGAWDIIDSEEDNDSEEGAPTGEVEAKALPQTRACHTVLSSEDILSKLVLHLIEGNDWKTAARTLTVNGAFFNAGASVMWRSMDSLRPIFKLLPWFSMPQYDGVGVFRYTGGENWQRFNLYASHIQHFTAAQESMPELTPYHVLELLTLPERPAILFPSLRSVSISTRFRVPSVASPFLLVSPPLIAFQYSSYKPWDLFPPTPDSLTPPEDLEMVLPTMATTLQSFNYCGPTTNEFIHRICRMKSLRTLHLSTTSEQHPKYLQYIHHLPCIEEFNIEGLYFKGAAWEPRVMDLVPPTSRMPRLRALTVRAASVWHGRVALYLLPTTLRSLYLQMTRCTDAMPMFLSGYTYFKPNTNLEELSIEMFDQFGLGEPITSLPTPTEQRELAEGFETTLAGLKCLRCFSVTGIPPDLAVTLLPHVTQAMVSWPAVTRISFNVQPNHANVQPTHERVWGLNSMDFFSQNTLHFESPPPPSPTPQKPSATSFPGLSFLSLVIAKLCPGLLELEFHFDIVLVVEEPLEMFLDAQGPRHLRLQTLTINTGITSGDCNWLSLVSQSRKADIAMFLDQLFPGLEVIKGSYHKLWEDVSVLIKAFRGYGARILADWEGRRIQPTPKPQALPPIPPVSSPTLPSLTQTFSSSRDDLPDLGDMALQGLSKPTLLRESEERSAEGGSIVPGEAFSPTALRLSERKRPASEASPDASNNVGLGPMAKRRKGL